MKLLKVISSNIASLNNLPETNKNIFFINRYTLKIRFIM